MKKKTITDLNRLYSEAESCDSQIFTEQRSNFLLAAGEHYNKKISPYWSRIRDSAQLTEEQKLRLTKNHLHRICNIYINGIFAQAPGVGIIPKNEKELQDQKAAELYSSVWEDWKQKNDYRSGVRDRIDDFVKGGEVAVKIFYDPNAGDFLGYEPEMDEMGQPVMDEYLKPVMSTRPRFSGKVVVERIFTPNLLRMPHSQTMGDSCLIYRKMVDVKALESMYEGDEEKLSYIKPSQNSTYKVFEGQSGDILSTENQTMVREFYEPPCHEYPNGYFWISTEVGILEEGELPFGVMPILVTGFDKIPTTPRGRSLIKQLRPYQAELNRCASAIATHQVTLSDDKLLIMSGTKVTPAGKLPGVRVLNYTGTAPTILSGRAGQQYFEYYEMTKREMYEAANIEEEVQEKSVQVNDPFAELFKSIRHKKKYALYAEKMVIFETKICDLVLTLSKFYLADDAIIPAIGRSEAINISEFKNSIPIHHEIKLVEQTDDYESKMGKQLTLNYALQYVGNQMDKEDIGRILRVMPYTNKEEIFSDLTTDYDNATNDILLLDRGGYPTINRYDNHKYMIKRLVHRTKQGDFESLHPGIQENYFKVIMEHEKEEAENIQDIQKAKDGFIPASGPLIAVDFYVEDPEKPSRTRRARLPYDAVDWLVKQLQKQGLELKKLEQIQDSALAELARRVTDTPNMGASLPATTQPNNELSVEDINSLMPNQIQ